MIDSRILCGGLIIPLIFYILIQGFVSGTIFTISGVRIITAVVISGILALHGFIKRSLNGSGALAGFIVGFLVMISSTVYSTSILMFFFVGSRATRLGEKVKEKFDGEFKIGGQRNWVQVISNGGLVTIVALLQRLIYNLTDMPIVFSDLTGAIHEVSYSHFHLAVLGILSTCAADTVASEMAPVLSQKLPVLLIKPWHAVPIGTNGGVTVIGFIAAVLGGGLIGMTHFITLFFCSAPAYLILTTQWPIIFIGAAAGFFGCLLDSLLGVTIQFSGIDKNTKKIVQVPGPTIKKICGYPLLDNHDVNLLSSALIGLSLPFLISRFNLFF